MNQQLWGLFAVQRCIFKREPAFALVPLTLFVLMCYSVFMVLGELLHNIILETTFYDVSDFDNYYENVIRYNLCFVVLSC